MKSKKNRRGGVANFNLEEHKESITFPSEEAAEKVGFITGYDTGIVNSCAANAFLLLGVINEINASLLAFFTQHNGLSWAQALLLLNRTFKQPHKFFEIVLEDYKEDKEYYNIQSWLEPGKATLGAVEPVVGDPTPGHYFIFVNHAGTLYVADSCEQTFEPFTEYKKRYKEGSTIAAVWSGENYDDSLITKQIIVDTLSQEFLYTLHGILGMGMVVKDPVKQQIVRRQKLIAQCEREGFSMEEGVGQRPPEAAEGGRKTRRKTKKRKTRHLKIKR